MSLLLAMATAFETPGSGNQDRRKDKPAPREGDNDCTEHADRVHVLMNNCYGDYGVRNARQLAELLAR